ncbi:MAG TPA: serine/threonine-protein kinase [Jiangellaceae bacterium]|nr:serine/threonine-protein kinase [Jiangellaceae bacterium]
MTMLTERYELAELMGSGGMAEVHAAYDHVLRRRVAVKIIHVAQLRDPVSRERFIHEGRVAAGLQHPNTVAIFDVGEDAGRPFIVMELLDGQNLADRIWTHGRLTVDEVVPIIAGILAGLEAAHSRGLVHRDVKPSNILLPFGGGVKLVDFGVATLVADSSTQLTTGDELLGTPRYLAPERVSGQRATPASDIYSLGAVLYECLSGRPPFVADTPVAVAVAHQREPIRPLGDVAPDVPQGIAAVAERALAKDPAERFGSAAEMRAALLGAPAVAEADPPMATLSGMTQRLPVQPVRRRWLPVAVGLLAVAVFGIAAVFLLTRGDDPGGTANQPAAEADAGSAGSEQETEPPPDGDEADREPADLDGLIATVAAADQTGEKTDSLLDKLRELSANPDDGEARKLIEEVGKWTAEGELDPDLGHAAIGILEEQSRPSDPELARLSELFAEVSSDSAAWGSKADNLASELSKLMDTDPPGQRMQQARKLADELDKWISEGEIDSARGNRAQDVLAPLQ